MLCTLWHNIFDSTSGTFWNEATTKAFIYPVKYSVFPNSKPKCLETLFLYLEGADGGAFFLKLRSTSFASLIVYTKCSLKCYRPWRLLSERHRNNSNVYRHLPVSVVYFMS